MPEPKRKKPHRWGQHPYYRFGWGPLMVGITLALIGVLQLIVQGGLIKWFVHKLGERRALIFGLACGTLGLALQALAPTGYWFWAAMPVVALWGVAQPALQALMSHLVDPSEQGRLQGAVMSVSSLSGIVGSIVFPATLVVVTASDRHDLWAGAGFLLAAALLAVALLLAYCVAAYLPAAIAAGDAGAEPMVGRRRIARGRPGRGVGRTMTGARGHGADRGVRPWTR